MRPNSDIKKMLAVTASIIGLISSLLTFFTSSFNKSGIWIGSSILLATLFAILIISKWMPRGNLPDGVEEVSEEMETERKNPRFKVVFPCDKFYYNAANKLARQKFGKNSVSNKTVEDWRTRNEFILTCLSDNNRMVGYFDILPLRTEFALDLINGKAGEKDITGDQILGFHEIKHAEYIYFAGIAVQNTESGQGCIHATYLLASAVRYVDLFYKNTSVKKILTIPTSQCGLKLTQKLNFSLERGGELRKDGYDLYSKDYDPVEIQKLIHSKKRLYQRFDDSGYQLALEKILS
jgi:hypothetical protein